MMRSMRSVLLRGDPTHGAGIHPLPASVQAHLVGWMAELDIRLLLRNFEGQAELTRCMP